MIKTLYITLLMILSSTSVSAQGTELVSDSTRESILMQQLTLFIEAINQTAKDEKTKPDLSNIKLSPSAKERFLMLWEHFRIKTIKDFQADNCSVIQLDGGKAGYNVRDIDVTIISKQQFSGDSLQQLSIYFLPDGTILDVCIALNHEQYRAAIIGKDNLVSYLQMLSFCEKLKTAYYSKNIGYIEQSLENNLSNIKYPELYLNNYRNILKRVFARDELLDYNLNDINIELSQINKDIYGLSFKQSWSSIHYYDVSVYFSLWDFRDSSKPVIHFTAIQSAETPEEKRITLEDFY